MTSHYFNLYRKVYDLPNKGNDEQYGRRIEAYKLLSGKVNRMNHDDTNILLNNYRYRILMCCDDKDKKDRAELAFIFLVGYSNIKQESIENMIDNEELKKLEANKTLFTKLKTWLGK